MTVNARIRYTVKPGKRPSSALHAQLETWQGETIKRLAQEPGPVKYPIRWTSERQRRYVLGFVLKRDAQGNIVPTQRSGKVREWAVFVDHDALDKIRSFAFQLRLFLASLDPGKLGRLASPPNDGVLIAFKSNVPYQRYVTGLNQQGFHTDTGWLYSPDIIRGAIVEAVELFQDTGIVFA